MSYLHDIKLVSTTNGPNSYFKLSKETIIYQPEYKKTRFKYISKHSHCNVKFSTVTSQVFSTIADFICNKKPEKLSEISL